MPSLWQNSDEIPFWIQLFLLVFVLIGIVPFFQKLFSRIDYFLKALRGHELPDRVATETGSETVSTDLSQLPPLNEYEYIVFRRLATSGRKGTTLKSIAGGLHMGRRRVESVLQSLIDKGLVGAARGILFGRRYALTRKGRDYALEQGVIVRLRRSGSS